MSKFKAPNDMSKFKAPNIGNRTTGFQNMGRGTSFFGHISTASSAQAAESTRISSYALANPSYAQQVYYNPNFKVGDPKTAVYSGVANVAGYGKLPTKAEVRARHDPDTKHPWAPMGHSMQTGFGLGGGRTILSGLRFRRSKAINRSTGWIGLLTLSSGPNKAFALGGGGRGQSSEDSTKEVYSTIETRMGTRASFTDETWNEAKGKFAQSWAGFKDLGDTGGTPFLRAELGQMFNRKNPNIGFARRVKRGL